jgi:hypothetical protein
MHFWFPHIAGNLLVAEKGGLVSVELFSNSSIRIIDRCYSFSHFSGHVDNVVYATVIIQNKMKNRLGVNEGKLVLPLFANFGNAYITYHISPNWQS